MTFDFTLTISPQFAGAEYLDRLYEAGCSDASVSVIDNTVLLDFAREADNMEAAVISAMLDVQRAGAAVLSVSNLAASSDTRAA